MESQEKIAGLEHLGKTALPLIGRIGAVAGGIVSLLTVLETVSGEVIAAIEGFLLVSAIVTSSIVAFHRSNQTIEDAVKKVWSYPQRARWIAMAVMAIASILLVLFFLRLNTNFLNPRARLGLPSRATPALTRTPDRATVRAATIAAPPTNAPTVPPTTAPSATRPISSTAPATRAPTPVAINQITDVALLNKLGKDALDAQDLIHAVDIFSRTLEIDATNAQAQFGLGQAYFYLNNFNAALRPLQIALQLNPTLTDPHAYLGFIYDYRQDLAKARAEYEEYNRVAARDAILRAAVTERLRRITGAEPAPTLTPFITATPLPRH